MYYKGNLKRCEDYNAIVSYGEVYQGIPNINSVKGFVKSDKIEEITECWSEITEREGNFYIIKHPDYSGTYLTEVAELPTPPEII